MKHNRHITKKRKIISIVCRLFFSNEVSNRTKKQTFLTNFFDSEEKLLTFLYAVRIRNGLLMGYIKNGLLKYTN